MHTHKKIGVVVATSLSVTIVVGAGLLALPGLSYSLAGQWGYVPWIVVACLMVPLLYIFSYFAARHPSAGGVVGYIRVSLGQTFASMAEMIVLGTFTLGIPAIALIGAEYLRHALPQITVLQAGLFVLALGYCAGMVGLKISGAIQTVIAACIVLGLSGIAIAFLYTNQEPVSFVPLSFGYEDYKGVLAAIPILLFAYTGWEMTAFLAEDMKNPKRDMPISIWISFLIVSCLYIFIAWTVATFAQNTISWQTTPFVELAERSLGEPGALAVGVIAALLVAANVVAATLSASRAVYSAGRDGLLPRALGKNAKNGTPVIAMTLTWIVFSAVVIITEQNSFGTDSLLQLAGQNFFVLYLLCALGFCKIQRGNTVRFSVGVFSVIIVLAMLTLFSIPGILYCSALALGGFFFSKNR